ncbi:MAG TPA: tyrosine-type recombinase/integrase [Xanthobacteraceae bacterium]|nr:tyrosine-type recombinase/integrase [Xanthobacteraceae bacterium]
MTKVPTGKLSGIDLWQLAPGTHSDGDRLLLQVSSRTARSWIYRYQLHGKTRDYGLGPLSLVSLSQARKARDKARYEVKIAGRDLVGERLGAKAERRAAATKPPSLTFREWSEKYIEENWESWQNPKHREQWRSTIKAYALPHIGDLSPSEITAAQVLDILRQPVPVKRDAEGATGIFWVEKNETARRVAGRIRSVLDYSRPTDDLSFVNPAELTRALRNKLPRLPADKAGKNFPALPYDSMPRFMAALRGQAGNAARAVDFLILTAARSGEARGAKWNEIDWQNEIWVVPAARMKKRREHKVPLSPQALTILRTMQSVAQSDLIFSGQRGGTELSDTALRLVPHRLGFTDISIHGFRSTFASWRAAKVGARFSRELAEAALAHMLGDNDTERAYQRDDMVERRRELMAEWADFCDGKS